MPLRLRARLPEDEAMKLTPALLLVPLVWISGAHAQSPTPSEHDWRQSQHRDAADTYTFTRFVLLGRFLTPLPGHPADRPALSLDCITPSEAQRVKLLAADLLVGTPLKIVYVEPEEIRGINYFPKVAVRYDTDGSGQEKRRWDAGTDRVPTGKPNDKTSATVPADALKKMLGAHTVVISVDSEQAVPVKLQFDIPDSASIRASCNM
jgi:hypothetical protein